MTKQQITMAAILLSAGFAAGETADLKISRVALFSSGVGFFEREARVSGSTSAELKFRAAQINDILKSLVVQDLDGGSVGVVGYASKDPLERTLASFAVNLTKNPSLAELLNQLRGEPVEITHPRAMKGTILGVEVQQVPTGKDTPPLNISLLNIMTPGGFEQVRVDQMQGLKFTNEKIAGELRQAMAVLAGGHDADKRTVSIQFDGQGERRVRASFLLESPIWKTSYRLVLSADQKPFLQGWAAVDNATEEDWKDVKLSLVSGRPISFQMDLYTPIYIPRPVEDLELYASLRAPGFGAGFGGATGKLAEAEVGGPGASSAGRATRRLSAARAAVAAPVPGSGERVPALADDAITSLGLGALAESGVKSVAQAQEAGELFEYRIETPVSIGRQNSALLPIVNASIDGEKLSIFNPASHPRHPLNGLRIENTTGLHLMQGPITLFEGNVYAGDAKLPDVKKGEKRLIAYALDLGMEMLTEAKPVPEQVVSFRIAKGTLIFKRRHVDERKYTARNKTDKARMLLIEHGYSPGWTLVEPKEPEERTQNLLRFRVSVPAGKEVEQVVRLELVSEQTVALSDTGLDAVQAWLRSPVITPALQAALEKIIAMRTELDTVARRRGQREKEAAEAVAEQSRVRENLKTLQQNTDPYRRQLTKFDALETQIEQIRGEIAQLRQIEEQKRTELQTYLLSVDIP